jgi:hypothetical protein
VAAVALGFVASLVAYLTPGNGIDHTYGALLVVGSTLLMLAAGLVIFATTWGPPVLRTVLVWLIALDIICTGFAAYMLEATVLLVLMIIAAVAWIIAKTGPAALVAPDASKAVRA